MKPKTVRLLSAYLCFLASALAVGAVFAGPPTPLIPSQRDALGVAPADRSQVQPPPAQAGQPVPLAPYHTEPRPPQGNVMPPQAAPTPYGTAAPAETRPGGGEGFGQRAGRTVDQAVTSTGAFFDQAAGDAGRFVDQTSRVAGEAFTDASEATGSAFDWLLRETGDLMRRSGETLQRWSE